MDPLTAVRSLATQHGLPADGLAVLKDGSNLLVHLRPAPVVMRVATFTAFIRRDPFPYLQREVALGSHLAAIGAAVVPPSAELPPGPHAVGEWWLTAWEFVPHDAAAVPDPLAVLSSLDELHGALATFAGALPEYGPVAHDLDLAMACCEANGLLTSTMVADLAARRDELLSVVVHLPRRAQHGDAFPGNLLVTAHGLVWNDLEDCCAGSTLWDLCVLARRDPSGGVRQVAVDRFGAHLVAAMTELREIQSQVWTTLHTARAAGQL
jgi:hypothetical protein